MSSTLRLNAGEAALLSGPMGVQVLRGKVFVQGATIGEGSRFVINRVRSYVALALEQSELDITMTDESAIQSVSGDDPFWEKLRIAEDILRKGYERVMLVGGTDCGKSSFATMLFNMALERGRRPAIVDGDIGQANVGPPGFIALGASIKPVMWNTEMNIIAMRFVGDIRPQHRTYLISRVIKELADSALTMGYDLVIMDTDGWVKDEKAVEYKHMLIDDAAPRALVVVGEELGGVFGKLAKRGIEVYEVRAPRARRARSKEDRRLMRSMRYRDFVVNAPLRKLDLNDIEVMGHPLFYGREVDPSSLEGLIEGRALRATAIVGSLHIYGNIRKVDEAGIRARLGVERIRVYRAGFEKGLYCALTTPRGDYPGLIERFYFETGYLYVRTFAEEQPRRVKLGIYKLGEDFAEEYLE